MEQELGFKEGYRSGIQQAINLLDSGWTKEQVLEHYRELLELL